MKASELAAAMAEAGAPMQAILIALRAIEDRDAALEEGRAKEAERTRRYRQRGGGQISAAMRMEILDRDGHRCLECGATDCLEIDHIIPLAKGGHPTDPENLQTLCRPCNARKRDRIRKSDNRGKFRTGADSANVTDTPPLSLPPNENNSNPPTHTPPEYTPRARADDFPCPDGVDQTDWNALKANRKAKRAALTVGAHRQILRKLEEWGRAGWPPGPIVAAAAERGWTTVFETDEMKAGRNGKPPHDPDRIHNAYARVVAAREAGGVASFG